MNIEREEHSKMCCEKNKYEIAGLKILMTTYYNRTRSQAEPYLSTTEWEDEEADGIIDFGEEFYREEQNKYYQDLDCDNVEYLYTGSLFNRFLIKYNGCMLHSSAVVVDGYAYLFSADSGTGKSTHTGLWLRHFGDRAVVINDDKPAIRFIDGKCYVYGTPWSGKNDINENIKVNLGAIVFLERSKQNWIEEISVMDAIPRFFKQTIRKLKMEENMDLVLQNMEKVLMETPIYKMGCSISDDAVTMAYEKIRRV